jgi:hypothetical protein
MNRQAVRGFLALAALTGFVQATLGQATPDRVYIRNKDGTTKSMEGELKFGAAGFQVVGTDKKALPVSFADVVKVAPGELQGADRGTILALISAEEKKTKEEYAKARLAYEKLQKDTLSAPARTQRYVAFKLAQTINRIADETGHDENWVEVATEASKAWDAFINEHKGNWEVWPAAQARARINAELGKFDEVARTWNRLTKPDAGLPPDLLLEAKIHEIDAQIRSKNVSVAQVSAAEALKTAPPGVSKEKLAIYDLAAQGLNSTDPLSKVKAMEDKIAATKDRGVLGVAYSMLGELYLAGNRPRDAMWAFLWVETVYNADRDEAFKAMCRLLEVFKLQGDDDRVKAYQDKLRRNRVTF